MNKPLRAVAIFCGLLVLGLLIRANWLQYVRAPELASDTKNRRVQIEQFATPRGDIIVGGRAVTGSKETETTDLKYKRTYVDGPMYAPVTGYASQAQGMTLLEKTYDGILTGKDDRLAFQRFADCTKMAYTQGTCARRVPFPHPRSVILLAPRVEKRAAVRLSGGRSRLPPGVVRAS